MRALKRVVVLSIELIAEALLLGCLLGVLVSNQTGLLYGVVGSALLSQSCCSCMGTTSPERLQE